MVVISVDPGSVRLGYAVFCCFDECFLKKSGVLLIPEVSVGARLAFVFDFFSALIGDLRREYADVEIHFVVEKVFLGKGVKSSFLLSAFYYHIFFVAAFHDSFCSELLAVEVKSGLVGSGRASKSEIAEAVILRLPCVSVGLESDEYDAIALGYVFLMRPPFS